MAFVFFTKNREAQDNHYLDLVKLYAIIHKTTKLYHFRLSDKIIKFGTFRSKIASHNKRG